MEEFPGNQKVGRPAKKAAPAKPVVERVTVNEVTMRKKPLGKRFKETYLGGDARSVWGYVAMDVIVPAMKDMVVDSFVQGVERMVYGEARPRSRSRAGGSTGSSFSRPGYTSYGGLSSNSPSRPEPRQFSRPVERDYDEIVFETRVEAETVLDQMYELLSQFGQVTVADLYSLIGRTGSYVDQSFGWNDLQGSRISRTRRGGYAMDIPSPGALK